MNKKTVFITGVTGSMGGAGLNELLRRRDRFDLVALVRPSAINKKKLRELLKESGLRIVWGDLTCYEDVLACVTGADIVLHPAAMIAPAADHDPEAALAINVGSTKNILKAIKAQPDPDQIKLVNIGSVAMTGDRLYPIHVGRTGDPTKPSIYDAYACSKIDAEQLAWQCWLGHHFQMTPNTVLKGGHWCPHCAPQKIGWDFDTEAKNNPFFAQVWYPNHTISEQQHYPQDCYLDVTTVQSQATTSA